MTFDEALERRFKFTGRAARDNLPALAIARHKWGPAGDHGRRSLAKLARDLRCRRGVEIGTHDGESAVMWLAANSRLHLTCVDPYLTYNARHSQEDQNAHYAEATERLKPYNAEIVRAKSLEVVDGFKDRSVDFVYIDGDHEFDWVMQDLIRWAPKVRGGGLVILHDYCVSWRAGVMKAVDAYTAAHRVDPWYVTRDHTPTAFWERGAARAG